MVALIVSYFLLAYFFAPRAIFRSAAAVTLPLKFQRSRTEEITFAFWISIIPLTAALFVSFALRARPLAGAWFYYEEVFSSSYSEKIFDKNPTYFWIAVRHLVPTQFKFLVLYYALVLIEAIGFVLMIQRYGNWKAKCRRTAGLSNGYCSRISANGTHCWSYLLLRTALNAKWQWTCSRMTTIYIKGM